MDKEKSFSKLNNTELRFYELIGVKLFRKAVLAFEKFKHRKDGLQNENYHPKGLSCAGLKRFSGYLIYNALLHIISQLFAVLYFVIVIIFKPNLLMLDIAVCIMAVFNFYCIMLQRYIYLKMKQHICKTLDKMNKKIGSYTDSIACALCGKRAQELDEEYRLLCYLKYSAEKGEDCVLTDECIPVLLRLSAIAEQFSSHLPRVRAAEDKPVGELLREAKSKTCVFSRLELQVSRLQCILGFKPNENVLFGYSIVTESAECEAALRRLFPICTDGAIEFTVATLSAAYEQRGVVAP